MQWGLLEISNPGFSLAENPLKSDNQPKKNKEKKTTSRFSGLTFHASYVNLWNILLTDLPARLFLLDAWYLFRNTVVYAYVWKINWSQLVHKIWLNRQVALTCIYWLRGIQTAWFLYCFLINFTLWFFISIIKWLYSRNLMPDTKAFKVSY